jgi:hypothetical protein
VCNGRNHSDGCECGFGPPYDRDVPEYFDNRVGSAGGQDLSSAGPRSASLSALIANGHITTQLVSTFLWQSYIGGPAAKWNEPTGRTDAVSSSPIVYIVRHGRGWPRHDLLVFDPQLPHDKVIQGYVDVSSAELHNGWRNFSERYKITNDSIPRWLSGLSLQEVPEIAVEAMTAQRHFFIAMHPPRLVWTSTSDQAFPKVASPALAVSNRAQGKSIATAGVIAVDEQGRDGVTTALHALGRQRSGVFVKGVPGNVRSRDVITDSCFIELEHSRLPPCGTCRGPMTGVTPGRGEEAWFDGITSGRVTTHVDGWTPELPWPTPGVQSRIITPVVTVGGDSGAALVSEAGDVIGFALNRTGFNSKSPHSAWIWAESVFSALHLR